MALAWGQRVSDRVTAPEMVEMEFEEAQARWISFLRGLEPQFPGITGTARRLLVKLWFGFNKIVSAMQVPTGFKWCIEQVSAFAKFLVHRMVNARAVMLRTAEFTRRQQLEGAILYKLSAGPLCLRGLVRKFHNLPNRPAMVAGNQSFDDDWHHSADNEVGSGGAAVLGHCGSNNRAVTPVLAIPGSKTPC